MSNIAIDDSMGDLIDDTLQLEFFKTPMYEHFEIYPPDPRKEFEAIDKPMWHPLYFVEFTRWKPGDKMYWRLFKKNFIVSKEEWNKLVLEDPDRLHQLTLTGNEYHPYQLECGVVNEREGVVDMNTMEFLKFMVDAINDRASTHDMF